MKRKNRKIGYGIIITIIIVVFAFVGAAQYLLNFSLKPINRGKNIEESWEYMSKTYPSINEWIDSLSREKAIRDTFIYSPDGIKLHAYYVYSSLKTVKSAVIVHGYTDNAIRMMMIGYLYNKDLNYNILLPDLRYSGKSDGEAIQMGWLDRKDVIRWMDVANSIFGDSTQMVVHGISMGAATTMMVSGEKLPSYVKCFVEDCGYTSVWNQFRKELKEQFEIPSFPLLNIANTLCQIEYGWDFKEASAINQVRKCHLPMFFIHGAKDKYVPTYMVYELYKAKPQPKEIWIAPDAKHAKSYLIHTKEYTNRVKQFVDKYIK